MINKKLTIITKIGFDHVEFLGNKIEKIAKEKAGILRKNVPVIIARQSKNEALNILLNNAKQLNSNNLDDLASSIFQKDRGQINLPERLKIIWNKDYINLEKT